MFNNFPRHGKILSIVPITGIAGLLFWINIRPPRWEDPNYGLTPGTEEYRLYHGGKYYDTIPGDSLKKWNREAGD